MINKISGFHPLERRRFLVEGLLLTSSLAVFPSGLLGAKSLDYNHHMISERGSGRATGYAESNKIITHGGKTHVCWLDSEGDHFWVRIRTFDHRSAIWAEAVTIGSADDNHGGPALTIDSEGYLHIVYYPHHKPMRYRKSSMPNDASAWDTEQEFGTRCSYPTLVCDKYDTLYCTVRESFDDAPWQVALWKKKSGGEWMGPHPILVARYPGYSHFQESLSWSPVDDSLHLSCRAHEKSDEEVYGRIQTIAYMKSRDDGSTWQSLGGDEINIPAEVSGMEILEEGGLDVNVVLRAGAMAVLPNGRPALLYSRQDGSERGEAILAIADELGSWQKIILNDFLDSKWSGWHMSMPGGLCLNSDRKLSLVAQLHQTPDGDSSWGHPSNEIVYMESDDFGGSFSSGLISTYDANTPHWLPSIERPTGFNLINGNPVILYTAGVPGSGLEDILSNRVYALIE